LHKQTFADNPVKQYIESADSESDDTSSIYSYLFFFNSLFTIGLQSLSMIREILISAFFVL